VSPKLQQLKTELSAELSAILNYWSKNTIDIEKEGFVGQIDSNEQIISNADKGSVLNARILWSFSASYQITKNEEHKEIARRAFKFLSKTEVGG
jgi:mannobiose 2-epimerase